MEGAEGDEHVQSAEMKTHQNAVSKSVDEQQTDTSNLRNEVAGLTAERDALRLELSTSMWQKENAAYAPGLQGTSEDPGKLNRKVWMLEDQIRRLHNERATAEAEMSKERYAAKVELDEAVETEQAIATGLRHRIGRLEEKIRAKERVVDDHETEITRLLGDLQSVNNERRQATDTSSVVESDLREALTARNAEKVVLDRKVQHVEAEKQAIFEQLRALQSSRVAET